jgi:hypothetical protein
MEQEEFNKKARLILTIMGFIACFLMAGVSVFFLKEIFTFTFMFI